MTSFTSTPLAQLTQTNSAILGSWRREGARFPTIHLDSRSDFWTNEIACTTCSSVFTKGIHLATGRETGLMWTTSAVIPLTASGPKATATTRLARRWRRRGRLPLALSKTTNSGSRQYRIWCYLVFTVRCEGLYAAIWSRQAADLLQPMQRFPVLWGGMARGMAGG